MKEGKKGEHGKIEDFKKTIILIVVTPSDKGRFDVYPGKYDLLSASANYLFRSGMGKAVDISTLSNLWEWKQLRVKQLIFDIIERTNEQGVYRPTDDLALYFTKESGDIALQLMCEEPPEFYKVQTGSYSGYFNEVVLQQKGADDET